MSAVAMTNSTPRVLSLKRNFSWTLVGNLIYALSVFGVVFIIEPLGGWAMLGQYLLGNSICVPIFLFTNLQLRTVVITDTTNRFQVADLVTLRAFSIPISLFLIALISWGMQYEFQQIAVILALAATRSIESAGELCYAICQKKERMDLVSRSLMMKGPLMLLTMGLGIWLTQNLLLAIMFYTLSWLILFLVYDLKNAIRLTQAETNQSFLEIITPNWNFNKARTLIGLSAPLAFSALVLSASEHLPNIIVEKQWGKAELGIFGWFLMMTYAGLPVINALAQAIMPRLARYYAEHKQRDFVRVLLTSVGIGASIGTTGTLFMYFFGEHFLNLFQPELTERWSLLMLLMMIPPLQYGARFFGNAVAAMQSFRFILATQIISFLVFLTSSFLMGKLWGINGIALSLFVTCLSRTILCVCWTFFKLHQSRKEQELYAEADRMPQHQAA